MRYTARNKQWDTRIKQMTKQLDFRTYWNPALIPYISTLAHQISLCTSSKEPYVELGFKYRPMPNIF